jgi:hypothetical protein
MASTFRRSIKFPDLVRLSKYLGTRFFPYQVNNMKNERENIRKGRNIKEEQNVGWNMTMMIMMVIIIIT